MKSFPLILFFFMLACANPTNHAKNEKQIPEKNITKYHKPSSGFTDTLKISFPSAIFFAPDSLQWQQLKLVNDSMVYISFEHDCFFQMRNARNVIKQYYPHIKIIEALKIRYLSFEQVNGNSRCIDLDSLADPCGLFLFDKVKEPHPVDMTNIDTELGFYFKQ